MVGAVDNMETGLSATYGFDYEMKNFNRKFKFSMGECLKDTNDIFNAKNKIFNKRFSDGRCVLIIRLTTNSWCFGIMYLDQNFSEMNKM